MSNYCFNYLLLAKSSKLNKILLKQDRILYQKCFFQLESVEHQSQNKVNTLG